MDRPVQNLVHLVFKAVNPASDKGNFIFDFVVDRPVQLVNSLFEVSVLRSISFREPIELVLDILDLSCKPEIDLIHIALTKLAHLLDGSLPGLQIILLFHVWRDNKEEIFVPPVLLTILVLLSFAGAEEVL